MSYSTSGLVITILKKIDTVDPVVGNDNTQGYSIESRWINTTTDKEWVCTDAGTGAAVWVETTAGGGAFVTTDGTTSQDAALFTERADHVNAPAAGKGEIWVSNAVPNDPIFTDDTGADRQLDTAHGGLGTWWYSVDATPDEAGEMFANNVAPASTTQLIFFHDNEQGARHRLALGGIGIGAHVILRAHDAYATSHDFTVDSVTTGATTATYDVTIANTSGAGDWTTHAEWSLIITPGPGDVVGPASATDNRLARFDGTTGNILQGGPVGIGDDGNWTWESGATDPVIEIYERTTAPANSAAYGKIWVKDDAPTTLMFTDDDAGDLPVVTGPAAATDNAFVRFNGTTGHIVQSLSTATLTDNTAMFLSGSQAELQMQERASALTPTAAHGTYWVKNEVPSEAWFTDDTDVAHNLNRPTPTTLASNELIQLDQTEIVIGGGYLDGGTGGTFSWEALATQIDGGGGVLLLTSEIRLYDMGPDGTPTAGTLRSSLEFPTDDSLDRVSLALTASASPGTDTDTIQDAPRMYEVRAYLDSTGGNVDSLSVLNVKFVES